MFMSTTISERSQHLPLKPLLDKDKRAQSESTNSAMPPTNTTAEPSNSPNHIESIDSEIPPGQRRPYDYEMVCGHSPIPELVTDQSHCIACQLPTPATWQRVPSTRASIRGNCYCQLQTL
jgi:hypothetical protein